MADIAEFTREAVVLKANSFLVEEFEVDENLLLEDSNMSETLQLDSIDYVDLIVIIEEQFGFKIPPEDFKTIHTFKDFYDYIIAKTS